MSRTTAIFVSVGLLLAACGGDSSDEAASESIETTETTETTSSPYPSSTGASGDDGSAGEPVGPAEAAAARLIDELGLADGEFDQYSSCLAFEQVDTFFEFIPLAEDSLAPTEEEVLDSFRAGATLLTAWAAEAAPEIRDEAELYAENVNGVVNLQDQGLEGDQYEEAVDALEETLGGARQTQEAEAAVIRWNREDC